MAAKSADDSGFFRVLCAFVSLISRFRAIGIRRRLIGPGLSAFGDWEFLLGARGESPLLCRPSPLVRSRYSRMTASAQMVRKLLGMRQLLCSLQTATSVAQTTHLRRSLSTHDAHRWRSIRCRTWSVTVHRCKLWWKGSGVWPTPQSQ